jgi:hypothetical protein
MDATIPACRLMTDKAKNSGSRVPEMVMLGISLLVVCTIALFFYWNFEVIQDTDEQRTSSREIRHLA